MASKPYHELTNEKNSNVLGTLTRKAWIGLAVEDAHSEWFHLTTDLSYLREAKNPHLAVMNVARESSGSIDGEHRKDLTTAIVGSPQQQSSLSIGVASLNGGNGAKDKAIDVSPKRGF